MNIVASQEPIGTLRDIGTSCFVDFLAARFVVKRQH